MTKRLLTLCALSFALAFSPTGSRADDSKTVTFGFYPSHNRAQLVVLAEEFCQYVSGKADCEVTPFVSMDYDDLIAALGEDKVQFAWMSPLSFVKAEQKGNARVLLKSVRGSDPFYWGAVIVRRGGPIETLADLEGKKMGWTYPSSTAGYIFTKAAIHGEGIDPATFFSENVFLGGYDELVKAVLRGQVDAGACYANDTEGKRGAWTQYLDAGDSRKIMPIYFTKRIPGDTITGSKMFIAANPKLTNRLLQILLNMGNDPEGQKLLTDLYQVDYLVDAEKEDYDSVREAAKIFPDRW